MENPKPRRLLSLALGTLIIFSTLVVMNFTSMNVLADDTAWNNGHTVTGSEWYENTIITMQDGNLTIQSTGTLTFNDSVIFKIINPEGNEHKYGIIIEEGGKFIIDSSSTNTEIVSDPSNPDHTYPFLNSGTIDFL